MDFFKGECESVKRYFENTIYKWKVIMAFLGYGKVKVVTARVYRGNVQHKEIIGGAIWFMESLLLQFLFH